MRKVWLQFEWGMVKVMVRDQGASPWSPWSGPVHDIGTAFYQAGMAMGGACAIAFVPLDHPLLQD